MRHGVKVNLQPGSIFQGPERLSKDVQRSLKKENEPRFLPGQHVIELVNTIVAWVGVLTLFWHKSTKKIILLVGIVSFKLQSKPKLHEYYFHKLLEL